MKHISDIHGETSAGKTNLILNLHSHTILIWTSTSNSSHGVIHRSQKWFWKPNVSALATTLWFHQFTLLMLPPIHTTDASTNSYHRWCKRGAMGAESTLLLPHYQNRSAKLVETIMWARITRSRFQKKKYYRGLTVISWYSRSGMNFFFLSLSLFSIEDLRWIHIFPVDVDPYWLGMGQGNLKKKTY